MEDIHRLLRKFDEAAKALEQDLVAVERRQAASLGPLATPEALEAALQWHERALAEVTARLQRLDTPVGAARDGGAVDDRSALRAQLAQEAQRLTDAIAAIRSRLGAPPTTTE